MTLGWRLVGVLSLLAGVGHAQVAGPGSPVTAAADEALTARDVAEGLAGEWEGQIQVRARDGSLSTSVASMSARLRADGGALEIYYEGFAFGKPANGAMLLSLDGQEPMLTLHDQGSRLSARCGERIDGGADLLAFAGRAGGARGELRALIERDGPDHWQLECRRPDETGEWQPVLSLRVDRLEAGTRSAAAAGFANATVLESLRRSTASASVDTDR